MLVYCPMVKHWCEVVVFLVDLNATSTVAPVTICWLVLVSSSAFTRWT